MGTGTGAGAAAALHGSNDLQPAPHRTAGPDRAATSGGAAGDRHLRAPRSEPRRFAAAPAAGGREGGAPAPPPQAGAQGQPGPALAG